MLNRIRHGLLAMWFLALAILPQRSAVAQASPEIIRGRVTDTQERPVVAATVAVTADRSQSTRLAQTDRDGRFVVLFSEGEGSYTLLVRKIGFTPSLRRVMRSGPLSTITADAVLAVSAYPLEAITVRSLRLPQGVRPERKSIGGLAQDALDGSAFLEDPSNLDALMGLLPGVQARGDSGYSVLGSSQEQNSTLLDGMTFDGSPLPPDAACGATLATTTSDPSRGQFAGGQTSVTTCRGREYFAGGLRASLAEPRLAWADDAGATSPSRLATLNGYLSGPLREGTAHYRLSLLGFEQRAETPSLVAPRNALLSRLGLSPDSISAATAALQSLGILVAPSGASPISRYRTGSALLNMDWNVGATSTLLLTASGSWSQRDASGISQLTFPTVGGRNRSLSGRVAIRGSTLVHGLVDEFSGVISASRSEAAPNSQASAGIVRVETQLPDGASGLTSLRFGGGLGAASVNRQLFELKHQLSWHTPRGSHRLTFGQQFGLTDWEARNDGNAAGTFGYNSLAELAENRPAIFSRNLSSSQRDSRMSSTAFWLADVWRLSNAISFEGGLRLDAQGIGARPAYNPSVDSLFGRRTDAVRGYSSISPRIGFAWQIKRRTTATLRDPATGKMVMFEFIDLSEMTGEPRGNIGAGLTLFGNVGAYRGIYSPQRIGSLADETGLPAASRSLTCSGDAAPIPDWRGAGGSGFTSCRNGDAPPAFSSLQPGVTVLDPSFRPPVSWRGDLGLTGLRLGSWEISASTVLSLNRNTESTIDLNLDRDGGFTLSAEGNRPVFASPEEIVPQSGIVAPGAARLSDRFGRVSQISSDLRAQATQFSLMLWTPSFLKRIPLRIDYSFTHSSFEQRGGASDPLQVESFHGTQPLHQVVITTSAARIGWFTLAARLNLQSGTAFTPSVVGDINGDGVGNDRAFIPDPTRSSDLELAAGISSLLTTAPDFARRCIEEQFGRIASANSCRGPWQARLDLSLNLAQPAAQGDTRLHVTIRLLNAGAALMRLAGVSSRVSQGSLPPDGRLLYVTGFDPASRRYAYRVNALFGSPIGAGNGNHNFPPFQLQLGAELKLGGPPTRSSVRRLGLVTGRETLQSPERIRSALRQAIRNPVDTLLALSDSLVLTEAQVVALRAISSQYDARTDSLLGPVVELVSARGKALNDAMLLAPWRGAVESILPVRTEARNRAVQVLTEAQKQKLQALMQR
ncbi:MAG: carboxypeptidase regulatory-like domain-containing protein [Gemmatimonadales bacterium]